MAEQFRVLGQLAPAATTMSDLYTVASPVTGVTSSTLSVCNTASTSTVFRVAVRPAGVALALQHYLYYDAAIGGNVSVQITIGITLAPTDVVSVYSGNGLVAFHLYGVEVSS